MSVLRSLPKLRVVLPIVLCSFCIVSPSRAQSPDALFDQHYSAGHQLSNEQRYQEAVKEFESAYKIRREPTLALNIGRLYLRLKKQDLAVKYCAGYLNDVDNPPANLKQKAQDCVEQAHQLGSTAKKPLTKPTAKANSQATPLLAAGSTGSSVVPPAQGSGSASAQVASALSPGGNTSTVAIAPTGLPDPVSGANSGPLAMHSTLTGTTQPGPESVSGTANPPPRLPMDDPEPEPSMRRAPSNPATDVVAQPIAHAEPKHGNPQPADTATPLYKKWWLWTVVGIGVAGAAAGITAGVLSSRSGTNSMTTPDPDPLAQIPPESRIQVSF